MFPCVLFFLIVFVFVSVWSEVAPGIQGADYDNSLTYPDYAEEAESSSW